VLPAASGTVSSGTAGLITVAFSILMRSELFLCGLYTAACHMPGVRSMPSSLRYWLAQCLYHTPGGLHSGCAVAATAWVTLYAAQWWLAPVFGPGLLAAPPPAVAATVAVVVQLALLAGMIALAMPFVRWDGCQGGAQVLGWPCVSTFFESYERVVHSRARLTVL
jgi:hypothetical protein